MYKLSLGDYKKILNYYGMTIPKNNNLLKDMAEDVLSKKLCSCIKKVDDTISKSSESRAIAICTTNVFGRKGLKRGKFTCKKKMGVSFTKKNRKMVSLGSKNEKNEKRKEK